MFGTNIKRILKGGFLNFWRNGVVSLSSILVMVIALFMIGSTILISAFLNATLSDLQEKVDVNIYLLTDATEEGAIALQKSIEALPEVAYVVYVSKEEVLLNFRERHEDDQLTLQALDEVGDNPFGPILNVKAVDPSQYGSVQDFLEGDSALVFGEGSIVDHTNYHQNKVAIEKLSSILDGVRKFGIVLTITLVVISILITFNTIRLAIYISREEISVMRLVGARNFYIRGPFVMEGVLYGFIAALISVALFYPITIWITRGTQETFGGIDLFQYYVANFNQIFVIIVVSGIALGAVSSYLAVRRYLRK